MNQEWANFIKSKKLIKNKKSTCSIIKILSANVYDFIINVCSVQEESITEYIIWQIKKFNKSNVMLKNIKIHTKIQEASTGTDFELELWVIDQTKYIPFLIQAKNIKKETNSYCIKSLNYNISKPTKQYQLLIDTAKTKKMIPKYLFYTNKSKLQSLYIADAEDVKALAIRCIKKPKSITITKDDILDISTNIIDFFCKFETILDENKANDIKQIPVYIKALIDSNYKYTKKYTRNIIIVKKS